MWEISIGRWAGGPVIGFPFQPTPPSAQFIHGFIVDEWEITNQSGKWTRLAMSLKSDMPARRLLPGMGIQNANLPKAGEIRSIECQHGIDPVHHHRRNETSIVCTLAGNPIQVHEPLPFGVNR